MSGNRLKLALFKWAESGENSKCADCNRERPTWASISIGVFLCADCAGIHRSMGTHISKIRSIQLDNWTEPMVQFMLTVGNEKANMYWENRLPYGRKIQSFASPHERNTFIRQKYEQRSFYGKNVPTHIENQIPESNSTTTATKTSTNDISETVLDARARYLALKSGKTLPQKNTYVKTAQSNIINDMNTPSNSNNNVNNSTNIPSSATEMNNLFSGLNVTPKSNITNTNIIVSSNDDISKNNNNNDEINNNVSDQDANTFSEYTKQMHNELGFKPRNNRTIGASPWVKRPTNNDTSNVKKSFDILDSSLMNDSKLNQHSTSSNPMNNSNNSLFGGLQVKSPSSFSSEDNKIISNEENRNAFDFINDADDVNDNSNNSTNISKNNEINEENVHGFEFINDSNDIVESKNEFSFVNNSVNADEETSNLNAFSFMNESHTNENTDESQNAFSFMNESHTNETQNAFSFMNESNTNENTNESQNAFSFMNESHSNENTNESHAFGFVNDNDDNSGENNENGFSFMNDNDSSPPPMNSNKVLDPFAHLISNENNVNDTTTNDNATQIPQHKPTFGHMHCAVDGCEKDRISRGYCGYHLNSVNKQ